MSAIAQLKNADNKNKLSDSMRREIRAKARTITAKEFNRRYALMMAKKAEAHQ